MECRVSVVAGVLLAAAAFLRAEAQPGALRSQWRDVDVKVDGSHSEWSELAGFGKNVPFSVGLKNDGASLYLVLSSSDQAVPFLLAQRGLIVWFDAEGGTKKRFGIRYPVIEGSGAGPGLRRPGGSGSSGGPGREPGREPGDPPGGEGPPPESGLLFDPAKDGRWARLELQGPGKDDRRSLILEATPGIEVRVGRVEGTVVYEMKVPLQSDDGHPYAIGAKPGARIGIGLETPEVQRSEGGGGFSMPGMGGGRGFEPPKLIKAWATAQLAATPS